MLIRCRKCQALFSLQDGIAQGGAAFRVECGRCLEVFDAASAPRKLDFKTPSQGLRSVKPLPKAEPSPALERKAAPDELARALKPRRPLDPAGKPRARPGSPSGPGSDEGEFDAHLRKSAALRRKLLFGGGAVLLLGLLAGGFFALRPRFGGLPVEAQARLERARQKLLQDDAGSLEQAASLATEAARLAPGEARPEAERAFALLLGAASHKDLADRLEAAARELNDKVARLQIDKPDGFQAQIGKLADEVGQIAAEREPHVREATRLIQQGVAAAKVAVEESSEDVAALRSMALYCALTGATERGVRYVADASKGETRDPLVSYVAAVLAVSGAPSKEKQDRALQLLAEARAGEPRLIRAVYDAAEISLERGEAAAAREGFGRVLEKNPSHERAKRLLALMPAAQ